MGLVRVEVTKRLLNTIDNLNKVILEVGNADEIRAITDGIEDIAHTIKKLLVEGDTK